MDAEPEHPTPTGPPPGDDDDDVEGASDEGDEDESGYVGDDESGEGPEGVPYASCFAGSDAECELFTESCLDSLNTCARDCLVDNNCPEPATGTAVQRCESVAWRSDRICVVYCGVEGSTCPDGMVCQATELCPGDADSSTGADCEPSVLPICVWR